MTRQAATIAPRAMPGTNPAAKDLPENASELVLSTAPPRGIGVIVVPSDVEIVVLSGASVLVGRRLLEADGDCDAPAATCALL